MTDPREVVITADAHVGETDELRRRLPERFRDKLPEFGLDELGNLDIKFNGQSFPSRHRRQPTVDGLSKPSRPSSMKMPPNTFCPALRLGYSDSTSATWPLIGTR